MLIVLYQKLQVDNFFQIWEFLWHLFKCLSVTLVTNNGSIGWYYELIFKKLLKIIHTIWNNKFKLKLMPRSSIFQLFNRVFHMYFLHSQLSSCEDLHVFKFVYIFCRTSQWVAFTLQMAAYPVLCMKHYLFSVFEVELHILFYSFWRKIFRILKWNNECLIISQSVYSFEMISFLILY